jgi:hypothetical protein
MLSNKNDLKNHLFICTNKREGRASCGEVGEKMATELKSWIKENNLGAAIKVTKSGCFGDCENGVACYLYPRSEKILNCSEANTSELKKILENI